MLPAPAGRDMAAKAHEEGPRPGLSGQHARGIAAADVVQHADGCVGRAQRSYTAAA
jgi:hypothetical protein